MQPSHRTIPPASDAISTSDGVFKGTRYRLYVPKAGNATNALPLGVYTHGGGFVLEDLEAEDVLCRAFAEQANTILLSVDYRLAPEHKHPVQLQDTMTLLEWVYGCRLLKRAFDSHADIYSDS